VRRNLELETTVAAKYVVLDGVLNQRARWLAASRAIGFGSDALVSAVIGLARETIKNGRR